MIYSKNGPNWLNWQCCLAGSSKTAPRILIFSIAVGADYSFELIYIETFASPFIGHNDLFLGSVLCVSMDDPHNFEGKCYFNQGNQIGAGREGFHYSQHPKFQILMSSLGNVMGFFLV